jgi:hypothetical protein
VARGRQGGRCRAGRGHRRRHPLDRVPGGSCAGERWAQGDLARRGRGAPALPAAAAAPAIAATPAATPAASSATAAAPATATAASDEVAEPRIASAGEGGELIAAFSAPHQLRFAQLPLPAKGLTIDPCKRSIFLGYIRRPR